MKKNKDIIHLTQFPTADPNLKFKRMDKDGVERIFTMTKEYALSGKAISFINK